MSEGYTWDQILLEGSFDGVKFDFVSIREDHTTDYDTQRLPGVDGAAHERRGRNPIRWEIMAIFIEDDYPDTMNKLAAALRGGRVCKFVHPVFGEYNAACERFGITHDAEDAADSAMMQITLVEDISRAGLKRIRVVIAGPSLLDKLNAIAAEVLVALSAFQAALEVENSTVGLAVTGAVNAAQGVSETLEADAADMSTLAIQTATNGALATIDEAVALLADYTSAEMRDLSAVVLELGHAMRDYAASLIEDRPQLSTYIVPADTNLLQLAHDLKQDAEELLALNSFADPSLIEAGSKVLGYAE